MHDPLNTSLKKIHDFYANNFIAIELFLVGFINSITILGIMILCYDYG